MRKLCESDDDIPFRLRLGIAMFTLQRHAVRVSTRLHTAWPEDLLIEEHALVVRATGISTPTPSECLPIVDDDDDGYGVEQQETTAEKRAHLEQYVENYDGSGHSNISFVISLDNRAIPSLFKPHSNPEQGKQRQQELKDNIQVWLDSVNEASVVDEPVVAVEDPVAKRGRGSRRGRGARRK